MRSAKQLWPVKHYCKKVRTEPDIANDSPRPNADIDPTIWIDDDGTTWMFWGNGDCYMVKLKLNLVEIDGPVIKVRYRKQQKA